MDEGDRGERPRCVVKGCLMLGQFNPVVILRRRLSMKGPMLRVILKMPFCEHHMRTATPWGFAGDDGWQQLAALFQQRTGVEPKRELTRLSWTRAYIDGRGTTAAL